MSTFFISDLHLGHENMAIRRGFSCADEMNDHIIKCWNSVITKRDLVFILGDITMEKVRDYPILDQLKGNKTVVLGNHDEPQHVKELLKYVNKVAGMIDYKKMVILTHCPIHPSQLEFRYSYNIHGHVHENSVLDIYEDPKFKILDPRYINVCAEMIDYTPVEFSKLIKS
jgi:calcineurin-like phosphoesterase family protein